MDRPSSADGGGGVDKHGFYHWLKCKIHTLDEDSRELEFLLAVQDGDVSRLKELVSDMEEKDRAKLAEMHFDGHGLLHLAVLLGKIEVVRYFVEDLGFDVDGCALCGAPLGCAALFGEVAIARYLLDHGADPNKTDDDGSVALHKAVKNGNEELIRLLISKGARVDIAINHGTPLHIAASYGKTGAIKILLEHHANPNSISVVHGTPLVTALQSTKHGVRESDVLECVKLLVKAGADVNSGNPCSPLGVATRNGLTDCINYLLEAGANSNIPDNPGEIAEIHNNLKDRKAELKKCGEKAVKEKDYLGAVKFYSEALELDRFDATLYSNRSLCNLKVGNAQKALLDAECCIRIRPDWAKAHYRKGAALMSLKEYGKAYDTFMDVLDLDPGNAEIEKVMWEAYWAMGGGHISHERE